MRLKPGTIYFVRETDRDTGRYSDLVKIGLVESPRTARERLSEHQTGNPRKLDLDNQSVDTEAVGYVEAQLHKAFASKRVLGEWFRFQNESEIAEAVAKARELAAIAASRTPVFAKAEELSGFYSEGDLIPSTPEGLRALKDFAEHSKALSEYQALANQIKSVLEATLAEKGAEALEGIYKVIPKYYDPKFSATKFKAAFKNTHADLIAKCTVKIPRFSATFEWLLEGIEVELSDYVQANIARLAKEIDAAIGKDDFFALNDLLLQIKEEIAPLEWEIAYLEAEVKHTCGTAPGIEGVCTWVREIRETNKFIPAILADLDPEMYAKGIDQRKPSETRIFLGYKSK
jgi:hypothetical protein